MATPFDDPLLRQWHDADLQQEHAAEWYGRVQEMRNMADYYERSLIRYLKYTVGLTWQQIAEVVNANLSSRQAAQAKWRRLAPLPDQPERRRAGSSGRGGWPKGRPRRADDETGE